MLLAGCTPITQSVPVALPSQLVGEWRASFPNGGEQFPIRFSRERVTMRPACGTVAGKWRARPGGLFVVIPEQASPTCIAGYRGTIHSGWWLMTIAAFDVHGPRAALQTAGGATVLTLDRQRDATLPDPGGAYDGWDSELDRAVAVTRAHPAAPYYDLPGLWRDPTDHSGSDVTFRPDGSYAAHVSCNVQFGRWAARSGLFLALNNGTTQMGCPGLADVDLLKDVASVAQQGPRLLLFDGSGRQLRELWYVDHT